MEKKVKQLEEDHIELRGEFLELEHNNEKRLSKITKLLWLSIGLGVVVEVAARAYFAPGV